MKSQEANRSRLERTALEHIHALYGFGMALTRDASQAEDLVQETYLRAVRAFGERAPNGDMKGWLFAIMRNVWLNQIRHTRSGPRLVGLDGDEGEQAAWWGPAANDPHVELVAKLDRQEVRAAIAALPIRFREVVVLRDLEGFSYQEMATILGLPCWNDYEPPGKGPREAPDPAD